MTIRRHASFRHLVETLLVNNGSPDDSLGVALALRESNPAFRVIDQR